jgi:hypothetical protein
MWRIGLVGLCLLSLVACGQRDQGLSKEEAKDVASDAEKILGAAGPEGFSGSPEEMGLTSKYGKQLGELVAEAQRIDASFIAKMEKYTPEVYFQPAALADAAKRGEFRAQLADYRAACKDYGREMDGYYEKVRALSEEMDNRKYPELNKEIQGALHAALDSYEAMAVSYLALMDHLDASKPSCTDGATLSFVRGADQTKYERLLDRSTACEEEAQALAEHFEATRQAQLQRARGEIGEMKEKLGGYTLIVRG